MATRVLIVDDEQEYALTLTERLGIRDYDASACFSGRDAIEKVERADADVVVLDVSMPGMDGVETLREIKRLRPLTEVIMLTGHATVETAIAGMKLGAFDYLMKPCETQDLIAKIEQAYGRKAAQEERIREARIKEIIASPRTALRKNSSRKDHG